MNNNVCHPSHYNQFPIEVIEIIRHLDFSLGNVIKYILRASYKNNPLEDCDKALQYLKWAKEDNKGKLENYFQKLKNNITLMIGYLSEDKKPTSLEASAILMEVDDYLTTGNVENFDRIERLISKMKYHYYKASFKDFLSEN